MRIGLVLDGDLVTAMNLGWEPLLYLRAGVHRFAVVTKRVLRVRGPLC